MKYHIHKAVVIGSGTMGAAIAAHLANIGVPVTLLDIVPKDASAKDGETNKIVNEGWDRCLKAKPANLMSDELKTLVKLGNLEDDFGAVGEADWICEAIVENLKIKQDLMTRIDEVRKPNAIVSTNTSGIPVVQLPRDARRVSNSIFLATHFFNPPRYLKLLEIISNADYVEPDVIEFFSTLANIAWAREWCYARIRPTSSVTALPLGQARSRLDYILENGYTVDEVDAIHRSVDRTSQNSDLPFDRSGRSGCVGSCRTSNLAPLIPHDKLGAGVSRKPKRRQS